MHSVTATAANVHDLDQVTHLVRPDDEVVYADASYQRSRETAGRRHERDLSGIEWRIAARKGALRGHARAGPGHRLCPGRCARQVEHRS